MMMKPYLISYDVTCPRRLRRLHRGLKRLTVPVQYSVFMGTLSDAALERCIGLIERTIDGRKDDVRIYPLPAGGWQMRLGKPLFPEGIMLTDLPGSFLPDMPHCLAGPPPPGDGEPGGQGADPARPARRQARKIEARLQTGSRRGIAIL